MCTPGGILFVIISDAGCFFGISKEGWWCLSHLKYYNYIIILYYIIIIYFHSECMKVCVFATFFWFTYNKLSWFIHRLHVTTVPKSKTTFFNGMRYLFIYHERNVKHCTTNQDYVASWWTKHYVLWRGRALGSMSSATMELRSSIEWQSFHQLQDTPSALQPKMTWA